MQRHVVPNDNDNDEENVPAAHERHSLLHHISFQEKESFDHDVDVKWKWNKWFSHFLWSRGCLVAILIVVMVLFVMTIAIMTMRGRHEHANIITIQHAQEHNLDIGNNLTLWYRVWGNRNTGIPVLFVHGGPGNCIADYGFRNARYFDSTTFFVVEVDQRGTGKSQPSVRDDCRNMKYYINITIQQMSHDYELVRNDLKIDQWLVFGGSWGSTLAIDYVERYPERALGLIIRGIWLNTRPEFDAIYTRRAYENNTKRLDEFNVWFEMAAQEALKNGEAPLDPNDGERFFRINERMILTCNKHAIWHWHAWETNMMEQDPANLLDPFHIDYNVLPEATSVAFFENQIFLHGTFDKPMDLLNKVNRLRPVQTWMCQGLRDEVCPTKYGGKRLAGALVDEGVTARMQFLDAGHEDTDPVIATCLKDSVDDFLVKQQVVS